MRSRIIPSILLQNSFRSTVVLNKSIPEVYTYANIGTTKLHQYHTDNHNGNNACDVNVKIVQLCMTTTQIRNLKYYRQNYVLTKVEIHAILSLQRLGEKIRNDLKLATVTRILAFSSFL